MFPASCWLLLSAAFSPRDHVAYVTASGADKARIPRPVCNNKQSPSLHTPSTISTLWTWVFNSSLSRSPFTPCNKRGFHKSHGAPTSDCHTLKRSTISHGSSLWRQCVHKLLYICRYLIVNIVGTNGCVSNIRWFSPSCTVANNSYLLFASYLEMLYCLMTWMLPCDDSAGPLFHHVDDSGLGVQSWP